MDFLRSLSHPDEILALVKFKMGAAENVMPKCDYKLMSPTLQQCYVYLKMTSRSFAAVIQALDEEMRNAVCIFYLVLRALDTVEDDMTIVVDKKVPMLKQFYKNLRDPSWCFMESNEKDKMVLEDFPTISTGFLSLKSVYQEVIEDICKKMGNGMTVFLDRDIDSMEEWNEYCHYVAGLVGIGLSRLFAASKLEDEIVGKDLKLANKMGLFLQKTNIIRDYLEDQKEGREFWPRATWSKYGKKLSDLAHEDKREDAVHCLNDLISNTLELIPDCIRYMSRLKNQSIFNFCAIPQVMAIGTLERCYNNPKVFMGVVKIRKGEAVKMMMNCSDIEKVKAIMYHFTKQITEKIPAADPNSESTRSICLKGLECCQTSVEFVTSSIYPPLYVSCGMMLTAIAYQYWSQILELYNTRSSLH